MFTIKTIRIDTCDDCHAHGNGVAFVLQADPDGQAFLCWRHFRMTLEAMRVASLLPEGGDEMLRDLVGGSRESPERFLLQAVSTRAAAGRKHLHSWAR